MLESLVDRVNIGVFIINTRMEIVLWNYFMEMHSGQSADKVVGKNLFDCFPDLPRGIMENKIKSVLALKNFAFSSWEQRPYLFKFHHNRPVTGGVDYMYQDYTFIPIKNQQGEVDHVCISLIDVTDTAIYQKKLKEALQAVSEASQQDGLTGIYNRHFLEETVAKEFSRVRRYGGTLSFIMFDIDNFKSINDTYGHLAGDEVLRATSDRLRNVLRQSDTLGRYGGEEFGAILPETDLIGAQVLAERIREKVERATISHENITLNVTISAGISEYHERMNRHEELIKEADDALYQAKNAGRNCVRWAMPSEDQDISQITA